MKKLTKLISLITAIALVLGMFGGIMPVYAASSGTCGAGGDNLTWTLDDEGMLTISGTGAMEDFTISYISSPAPWRSKTIRKVVIENGVTSIGNYAFYDCCELASIEIPDSVTSIGEGAFYKCSALTSIEIPDGVTSIGASVFYKCSALTSIEIPDNVTSIGERAFYDCDALTNATIKSGAIGEYAFSFCDKLTSVTLGNSVTSIGDNAFYHTEIINIKIPDSVETIGKEAFLYCSSLSKLEIGRGMKSIGANAFQDTGVTHVYITDVGAWSSISFANYYSNPLYYGDMYINGKLATDINIPNGVTSIGTYAFSHYDALTSIEIPDSVTSIGEGAFYDCDTLTSVTLGDGVTSIGASAFSYCTALTSIEIPDSVTSIGASAFCSCDKLTSIEIPDSVTSIGEGAFYSCDKLTSVTIGDGVTVIPQDAFYYCRNLKTVSLGKNVQTIEADAFDSCYTLSDVYFRGTQEDWNNIAIVTASNKPLLNATLHICPTEVKLNKENLALDKGSYSTLYATVLPDEAENKNVIWTSSNQNVATVSSNGYVTAVGKGKATITARAEMGGAYDECEVTVNVPVTSVSISRTSLAMNKGGSSTLTATAYPYDADDRTITWRSSNTSVATVSSNGYVTAVGKGNATITATASNGRYASCAVTVTIPVTGITLDKESIDLKKGESSTITANVSPSDASNKTVTWKSSNEAVAKVTDGTVTAVGGGTATITATTADGNYSKTCAVAVNVPVTGVTLDKTSATLTKNQIMTLTATIAPSDAMNKEVTWKSSNEAVAKVNNGTVTAVGYGEATITVTTADGSFSASCAVEVVEQQITGVTFENADFVYDGTEKKIEVAGTLPAGANVAYTENKGTDAGTYNATAVITADGYAKLTLNAKMTIAPKNITVSGLSAENKTYDGTKAAKVKGGSLSGKVTGDDVSATFPTTGTFANANVGTGIAVSIADITLSGSDKGNYTLTQPEGLKANITKAAISVKADDITVAKGAAIPTLTYTITSGKLFGNDTFTGKLATSANGTRLGTFDINKGTLAVSSNYSLTFTNGKLTVVDKTPQNVVVSAITEKTYGDSSFVVSVTPDNASGLTSFTYESSDTDVAKIAADGTVTIVGAGETDITVKQAGNETYAPFTNTQKLVVKKVAITINADPKGKRLGTADPALTYQVVGELVNNDRITGALEREPGEKIGKYDILIGTLAINDNYDITYNKAIFEIVDKTPQNIAVSEITSKTYGDAEFAVTVTPDAVSGLTSFTYESSNPKVAEISADGIVTIKAAGTTNITVKQAGNEDYAAFTKTQKLVVNKVAITVKADAKSKKIGTADPELTYQVVGTLIPGDSFTGKLTRKSGEAIGKYDILIGTLAINDNYKITYNKAVFEIVDKTPQSITVSEITDKVYGDASFVVTVEADATSGLSNFTYESSNTDVAEIAADGTVTIVGAGETEITVKEPGDDTYAAVEKTQKLVVAPKEVTVSELDLDAETAVITGVLEADADAVAIDLGSVKLEIVSEKEEEGTATINVTNVLLSGDKAANYVIANDGFDVEVSLDDIVEVTATSDKGTVEGEGKYLVGSEVTLKVKAKTGYAFAGWYVGDECVSKDKEYTFTAESDIALVAKFRSTQGSGGLSSAGDRGTSGSNQAKPQTPVVPVVPETPDVNKPEDGKQDTPVDGTESKFEDLEGFDWAKDAVEALADKGIIKGTSETTYSPSKNITRADFVALIVRVFGLESANTENFADVSASDYFAAELAIARNTGIVGGVGDNKFAPRANITRQDMMVMLYRAMTKLDVALTDGEASAPDFDTVSEYAKEAVSALMANGIINGKNGNVDPMANATRAEVAVMLSRVLEFVK